MAEVRSEESLFWNWVSDRILVGCRLWNRVNFSSDRLETSSAEVPCETKCSLHKANAFGHCQNINASEILSSGCVIPTYIWYLLFIRPSTIHTYAFPISNGLRKYVNTLKRIPNTWMSQANTRTFDVGCNGIVTTLEMSLYFRGNLRQQMTHSTRAHKLLRLSSLSVSHQLTDRKLADVKPKLQLTAMPNSLNTDHLLPPLLVVISPSSVLLGWTMQRSWY